MAKKDEGGVPSKKRLGKGLAALIGDMDVTSAGGASGNTSVSSVASAAFNAAPDRRVAIEHVGPNPNNPRRDFGDADLGDLAASIREHGIMQPILVRPAPGGAQGRFEIIAGERRWRAAQLATLHEVPVIVRNVDDKASLELAIVENVQRADLNPVEEALGYQKLMDEHAYTQNDLGQVIGKSRSHVANTLRLLKLPEGVLSMVADGSLSAGHARTLITADDPLQIARAIVDQGLSVRQAERMAQCDDTSEGQVAPRSGAKKFAGPPPSALMAKDADAAALERALSDGLGLKVSLDAKDNGSGALKIKYKTLEQLDDLCRGLGVGF